MNAGLSEYKKLWRKKLALLKEIHRITGKMQKLPEDAGPEEILGLIEDRQKVIDTIKRLDNEIEVLKRNEPGISEVMAAEKEQYREHLKSISSSDQAYSEKLQKKLLLLKEKLEKVRSDKRMLTAYKQGGVNSADSLFVDTKG